VRLIACVTEAVCEPGVAALAVVEALTLMVSMRLKAVVGGKEEREVSSCCVDVHSGQR
jgi:hypothetical protein